MKPKKQKERVLLFALLLFVVPVFVAGQNGGYITLPEYINNLYMAAVGLAGLAAVIMVVVGAVYFTTSAGSPSRQKEGKDYITSAILGLLLLLGAFILLNTINPQLIRLDDPPTATPVVIPGAPGTGTITGNITVHFFALCAVENTPVSPSIAIRAHRPGNNLGCTFGGNSILNTNINLSGGNQLVTISANDLEGHDQLCSFTANWADELGSGEEFMRFEGCEAAPGSTFCSIPDFHSSIRSDFVIQPRLGQHYVINIFYDCSGAGNGAENGAGEVPGWATITVDWEYTPSWSLFFDVPEISYTLGGTTGTITNYPRTFGGPDSSELELELVAPTNLDSGSFVQWLGENCEGSPSHPTCSVSTSGTVTTTARYQSRYLFTYGDRVQPTGYIDVRSSPTNAIDNTIGHASRVAGHVGTIDDGETYTPTTQVLSSGTTIVWWYVYWDHTLEGWSRQNALILAEEE